MRKRVISIRMTILFGNLFALSGAAQVLGVFQADQFVGEMRVIREDQFRRTEVLQLAREFVSRHAAVPIATLYLGPGREALLYRMGQTMAPAGFQVWASRVIEAQRVGLEPESNFAVVSKIGGNSVLRMKIGGIFERVVLKGRDPLFLGNGRKRMEILWIVGRGDGRRPEVYTGPLVQCKGCLLEFELYVRGECVSEDEARRAGSVVANSTGYPVEVHLRRDAWFVDMPNFPPVYPFDVFSQLPTETVWRGGSFIGLRVMPAMKGQRD